MPFSPEHTARAASSSTTAERPWLDVAIVGAGPAGIGMALTLQKLGALRLAVFDRARIGESYRRWPKETRFITPSFNSNAFGLADLNAVNELSSPGAFLGVEHPSGVQYAEYLNRAVAEYDVPVIENCAVEQVRPRVEGGFVLDTTRGMLNTHFVIWATGEYQFPDLAPFPGGQCCTHYAQVETWRRFDTGHYTVIGGYESGVDAAFNLVQQGSTVRLLSRKSGWDAMDAADPSLALSPDSRVRLRQALDSGRLQIVFGVDVVALTHEPVRGYRIQAADGRHWQTQSAPILGTGFLKGGGARQIRELWDWDEDERVVLSQNDESTLQPGLFLVGPQVRQAQRIFCFIYKFRQRYAFIATQIAQRLSLDSTRLQTGSGRWGPFGNLDCCEGCEC